MEKKNTIKELVDSLVKHIEQGTAPWQKPWKAGELIWPFNAASNTYYNGLNNFLLLDRGYNDPRWLTFKQASKQDYRIKKGERSSKVRFCIFTEQVAVTDENGNPVLDENGKPKYEERELTTPKVLIYSVFNASQIAGIEPFVNKQPEWNAAERIEDILANAPVRIEHNRADDARYKQQAGVIELPARSSFATAQGYYTAALHELAHAVRYIDKSENEIAAIRKDYGTTKGRAKEEVIADMTAFLLARDLVAGYEPQNNISYMAGWAEVIKDNPYALFQAASEAEKRKTFILGLELQKEKVMSNSQQDELPAKEKAEQNIAAQKTYLSVPYREKDAAKKLGAKWDSDKTLWYAPVGSDLNAFNKWRGQELPAAVNTLSAPAELAQAIQDMGGDLKGTLPVMDGKIHRVQAAGRAAGNKDISYCAFNDEYPAGWVQNFATGEKVTWSYSGHKLTKEELEKQRALHEQKRLERENTIKAQHEKTALDASSEWIGSDWATSNNPYLQSKGVPAIGIRQSSEGNLLIPVVNTAGDIRGLQFIAPDGQKRFMAGMEKSGNFHLIKGDNYSLFKDFNPIEILIVEGYATGASLHLATNKPVVVAFDAGNLEPVAKKLREKYPDTALIICADNDHAHKLYNVGVEKAQLAAESVKATVVIPKLTTQEKAQGLKDFNDIHASQGLDEVKKQIEAALNKTKTAEMSR
ncbi:ssDNA-binding domain-containing protein [Desulfovibrio sp. OttesenSCG-928-F07]|nr:ssDNA-binding domain-containing protein [Desulfovibrio sp. OttesenSCG-928-F07]